MDPGSKMLQNDGLCSPHAPASAAPTAEPDCVDRATHLDDLFLASDTTMVVLTDVRTRAPPTCRIPVPQVVATRTSPPA